MALELDDIVLETSQLQVALVKMARGVSSKLNITNKPYTFICPEYEEIKKGDWVVCEVKRKTPNKNEKFEKRCINITNKKRSLWARYNAYDRKANPDKKIEGVPMNVFDKLLDSEGKLHFDKLDQYSHKMTQIKKKLRAEEKKKKKK